MYYYLEIDRAVPMLKKNAEKLNNEEDGYHSLFLCEVLNRVNSTFYLVVVHLGH